MKENSFEFIKEKNSDNTEESDEFDFDSDELFNQEINNNIIKMKSSSSKTDESKDISLSQITEEYLNQTEEISEIKYILFMILYNECSYNDELSMIKSKTKFNEIKLKRLVIQDFIYDEKNNNIIYKDKHYSYTQVKNMSDKKNAEFEYNNNIITLYHPSKKDKNNPNVTMKFNGKELIDEFSFEDKHKDIVALLIKEPILTDSDKEVDSKFKFYEEKTNNRFTRYIYKDSIMKEIDSFFFQHKDINLNISTKVNLEDALENLASGKYDINNDLMCNIIFKNFTEDIITKDNPLVLEIKRTFDLYRLLNQIKQDSKILRCAKVKDMKNNDIQLPKYIIGIMCSNGKYTIQSELEKLHENYKNKKDYSFLNRCLDVIEKMNIKVVIGFINNGKLKEYSLLDADYIIPGLQYSARVDLNYLNEKVCEKKFKPDEIEKIISKYKASYKSIAFTLKKPDERDDKISDYEKKIKNLIKKYENKQDITQNEEITKDLKNIPFYI